MVVISLALSTTAGLISCRLSNQTVLFLGDSITEDGVFVQDIEAAWSGGTGALTARVVCRGIGGETVSGLSEPMFPGQRPVVFFRLKDELMRYRPDWVVACYGMNCGLYQPLDEKRFAAYRAGVEKLITDVRASGCRIILLTPPPYAKAGPAFPDGVDAAAREKLLAEADRNARAELEQNPNRYGYHDKYPYYDHVLSVYADWLKTLDRRDGVWVIDVRAAMMPRLEECYDKDPVHPNRSGHHIIAETFLKAWPGIAKETGLKTED